VLEGLRLRQPECIVLTYEFPSRVHLRQIAPAFPGVPVVSSYGSTETGHVFTRCDAGVFHENTATCHVEIQPLRAASGDVRIGRILVPTLDNPWFTLVRFDVGRHDGLAVAAIEGRIRDLTFDLEGRAVTVRRLDDALGAAEHLLGYQVDQCGAREYLARYTAEPHADEATCEAVGDILRSVYGPGARITVRREAALSPEQSGKFRLARTTFDWDPQELFS
jgi:hypothetical protein